jgi:hypothetical protein
MSGVSGDLMVAVNNFRAKGSSKTNIAEALKQMRLKLDDERQHQYDDPGPSRDRLFQDTYEHQGTELDDVENAATPTTLICVSIEEAELLGSLTSRPSISATSHRATSCRSPPSNETGSNKSTTSSALRWKQQE